MWLSLHVAGVAEELALIGSKFVQRSSLASFHVGILSFFEAPVNRERKVMIDLDWWRHPRLGCDDRILSSHIRLFLIERKVDISTPTQSPTVKAHRVQLDFYRK